MPDDEELREELARKLKGLLRDTPTFGGVTVREVLDALLPVVERYGRECAVEALRAAAEIAHCGVDQRRLDYRADALDGAQDRHGRTETETMPERGRRLDPDAWGARP